MTILLNGSVSIYLQKNGLRVNIISLLMLPLFCFITYVVKYCFGESYSAFSAYILVSSATSSSLLEVCLVIWIYLFELQDGCVCASCVTLFLFQISYFPLSGTLR